MKIPYIKVNPGGNTTAIVTGQFDKQNIITLCKNILESDKTIEQVGFWVTPNDKTLDARLEMAGGEFCGNALRALGAAMYIGTNKTSYRVECSGTPQTITLRSTRDRSSIQISTDAFFANAKTCSLPGISYILLEDFVDKAKAQQLLKDNNYLQLAGSGVVGYKKKNEGFVITPIVWVRDVETFFEETACGSGTMALAFQQFILNKKSILTIEQPSTAIFTTSIENNSIVLDGPIVSIEQKDIDY